MGSSWDDLVLTAVGEGQFTTSISEDWMMLAAPQGGIVAAIAATAMEDALGIPDQTLRTMSAVFAGMVKAGPVAIDVTVLRRGRSMSQATATLRNPGAEAGLTVLGVFGTSRRGFEFTELKFPDVRPPEECWSFRDPVPEGVDFAFPGEPLPFWGFYDGRPAIGRMPWDPPVPGSAESAIWQRIDDPPLTRGGMLDDAATIVLCDLMPGAVGERVGFEQGRWISPSADLTVHLFGPAHPGWLLAHSRARQAGDGYASVELALWDGEDRHLVAYATQIIFFSFPR
jgi:acyl-CoA thioesterase